LRWECRRRRISGKTPESSTDRAGGLAETENLGIAACRDAREISQGKNEKPSTDYLVKECRN
jgi:hypothetical protein